MGLLVLGASGYIGSAFRKEIEAHGLNARCLTRKDMDYTDEETLRETIAVYGPECVVNCAAYIPPSGRVDDCKDHPEESEAANRLFPVMVAKVCNETRVAFAHIGTGCLYDDAREYSEDDPPTRSWDGYCGTYLYHKYLGELGVREVCPNSYVWRIRLPFDEQDHDRNYLTKIRNFRDIWRQTNSLTHRGDFVKSALNMVERKCEWGVYHMTNSSAISVEQIFELAKQANRPMHGAFTKEGPASGCRLSTAKLEATGCGMRPVAEAVEDALRNWSMESKAT